tara:strand:+ start:153 stop:560 length:408 start_codon:yes stop_codon:yes gene_type:complete
MQKAKPDNIESLELNLIWIKRINLFLNAENKLMKSLRIEKITLLTSIFSLLFSLFSFYHGFIIKTEIFYFVVSTAILSTLFYPFSLFFVLSNKKYKNTISSFFYKENYEIDIKDNKAQLFNKANDSIVLEVIINK